MRTTQRHTDPEDDIKLIKIPKDYRLFAKIGEVARIFGYNDNRTFKRLLEKLNRTHHIECFKEGQDLMLNVAQVRKAIMEALQRNLGEEI